MKIQRIRNRFNDIIEDAYLKDPKFSLLEMCRHIHLNKNVLYSLMCKPDRSVSFKTLLRILNYFNDTMGMPVTLTDFFDVTFEEVVSDQITDQTIEQNTSETN